MSEDEDNGKLGVGMDWNDKVEVKTELRIADVLKILRAHNRAPILWHKALVLFIPKAGSSTTAIGSERGVNTRDPLGKSYYSALWPTCDVRRHMYWAFGFNKWCRREEAMLIHVVTTSMLRKCGYSWIDDFF